MIGKSFLALIIIFFTTSAVFAQNQCNERDKVLSLLINKYKEAPVAVGVTNTGGLVEVLSTSDGDTWTIIVTTPQGISCLVAAGEGWRQIELDLKEGPTI